MAPQLIDKLITILNPQRYKEDRAYLDELLTEYKSKHAMYEEFRIAMHKTIEALLKDGEYKYQIVSRTKTPDRLEEKLIRKREEGINYHLVEEVEDLVGIRVIFYTERDREKFIKKLKNEIGGFMKVEDRKKENGYKATHIILSFGPKRTSLSEYKHFSGLKSEVQVTSMLHHTWAEIEHDLIYKDIHGLKSTNPNKFESMKTEMRQILDKYIKKASAELEEIINRNT